MQCNTKKKKENKWHISYFERLFSFFFPKIFINNIWFKKKEINRKNSALTRWIWIRGRVVDDVHMSNIKQNMIRFAHLHTPFITFSIFMSMSYALFTCIIKCMKKKVTQKKHLPEAILCGKHIREKKNLW